MLVVLVVEPDTDKREGLGQRLRAAGYAVALCASAQTAPEALRPDAVVLPAGMSMMERRQLLGRSGHVAEVVHDSDDAGVMRELTALLARTRPIVTLSWASVDLRTRTIVTEGQTTTLTEREAALLAWLLGRAGQVASRAELLVNVWGYRADMVTRTVDATVSRLRDKIEREPSAPEHLLTVRGEGYRLVVPSPASEASEVSHDLFGRDDDLRRLRGELAPGRVVTLRGPGGRGQNSIGQGLAHGTPGGGMG